MRPSDVSCNRFEPGRLVDLGTGHGRFAIQAADLGWEVTAVDARTDRWKDDERIAWVQQDVREHALTGYDLIACLGLFYHLTCDDQLALLRRAAGRPIIIDTHLDHGEHVHRLSPRTTIRGYEGRFYRERWYPAWFRSGHRSSSWRNHRSFWPTLKSFEQMLDDNGFAIAEIAEPWFMADRTFFLAVAEPGS